MIRALNAYSLTVEQLLEHFINMLGDLRLKTQETTEPDFKRKM